MPLVVYFHLHADRRIIIHRPGNCNPPPSTTHSTKRRLARNRGYRLRDIIARHRPSSSPPPPHRALAARIHPAIRSNDARRDVPPSSPRRNALPLGVTTTMTRTKKKKKNGRITRHHRDKRRHHRRRRRPPPRSRAEAVVIRRPITK